MLERSKFAYKNKDSKFYENHRKVPVWVVFHQLTDTQKESLDLNNFENVRILPWPSTFYPEAIKYISDNGYPTLFTKEQRPIEVREEILIEMLDLIMRHFNDIVGPDPALRPYLDNQLYLEKNHELKEVFDIMLSKQEPITLSTMFDTIRSEDVVWITFVDEINDAMVNVLNTCSYQTVLVGNNLNKSFNVSEILPLKGENNEDLTSIFENLALRNVKKAQQLHNKGVTL